MPLKNLSGDPEQDYFADGVREDIIEALSRNRWLKAIARASSFAFKGENAGVSEIGDRLGARYVLEGSVRRGGKRIRVGAQLNDAATGKQIWAEHYDRELEDVFQVQDEVTEAIVAAIAPELGKAEQLRAVSKKPEDLGIWDLCQRGNWHLYQRTRESLAEARRLYGEVLERDPDFGAARVALVDAYYYEVVLGLSEDPGHNRDEAPKEARRAVEIDPDDASAHCAMGKARIMRMENGEAIANIELAVRLNPSLAWAHYGLGASAVFGGRAEEAVGHLHRAIELSPRDQHMGSFMVRLAESYLAMRDYEAAVDWARRSLGEQGFQWSRYATLVAALGYLDRKEAAGKVMADYQSQRDDFSVSMVRNGHLYTDAPTMEHYLEGLRLAGAPE